MEFIHWLLRVWWWVLSVCVKYQISYLIAEKEVIGCVYLMLCQHNWSYRVVDSTYPWALSKLLCVYHTLLSLLHKFQWSRDFLCVLPFFACRLSWHRASPCICYWLQGAPSDGKQSAGHPWLPSFSSIQHAARSSCMFWRPDTANCAREEGSLLWFFQDRFRYVLESRRVEIALRHRLWA